MGNVLLEKVDYKITETERGIWRRYMYPTGSLYAEYTSRSMAFGMPLIHYVRGVSPETGVAPVARGVIAIGRRAVGIVAIGRFAVGLLAVGQLSAGLIGIGQLTGGVLSLGQMALGLALGIGQVASGYVCIAQIGFGHLVLAQAGFGAHAWTMRNRDPEASEFFRSLFHKVF